MTAPIRIVSSMATRQVLSELVDAFKARSSHEVQLESVGGVEAARRVRAGEPFDAVVLATEVIDQLAAEGRVVSGSRVDLVRSGVSMAVRSGVRGASPPAFIRAPSVARNSSSPSFVKIRVDSWSKKNPSLSLRVSLRLLS